MHYKSDLHTHSNFSDSILSPRRLIRYLFHKGLDLIMLTDHDNFDGYVEAKNEADSLGIYVGCGIEYSKMLPLSLHGQDNFLPCEMLGVFLDPSNSELNGYVLGAKKKHIEVNEKVVDALNSSGYYITLDLVNDVCQGVRSDSHIAYALYKSGYFDDFRGGYDFIFSNHNGLNSEFVFNRGTISPFESIELTHAAGGLSFVPHPIHTGISFEELVKLIDAGLDGIEVYHKSANFGQVQDLREFALSKNLLISLGSDFHGQFYHEFDERYLEIIKKDLAWVFERAGA